MPQDIDEPLFESDDSSCLSDSGLSLQEKIERLVRRQAYGVLCTQGGGQPYGSLIALSFQDDLRQAVFATPTTTRKYKLLVPSSRVALLLDDRSSGTDQVMKIEAVTITGVAKEIRDEPEFSACCELLLARHPYLQDFLKAPTCALFRVDVTRYFHVTRFQEVGQWVPPPRS